MTRRGFRVLRLDHVLATLRGREQEAEAFYAGIAGLLVRLEPELLAKRGGRWFENGNVKLHLGITRSSVPSKSPIGCSSSSVSKPGRRPRRSGAGHLLRQRACGRAPLLEVRGSFDNRIEVIEARPARDVPDGWADGFSQKGRSTSSAGISPRP
jgi:hypothetical protein